ncbi:MAG: hypothetical protein AAF732_21090 [Pseudomonadota bacterium]
MRMNTQERQTAEDSSSAGDAKILMALWVQVRDAAEDTHELEPHLPADMTGNELLTQFERCRAAGALLMPPFDQPSGAVPAMDAASLLEAMRDSLALGWWAATDVRVHDHIGGLTMRPGSFLGWPIRMPIKVADVTPVAGPMRSLSWHLARVRLLAEATAAGDIDASMPAHAAPEQPDQAAALTNTLNALQPSLRLVREWMRHAADLLHVTLDPAEAKVEMERTLPIAELLKMPSWADRVVERAMAYANRAAEVEAKRERNAPITSAVYRVKGAPATVEALGVPANRRTAAAEHLKRITRKGLLKPGVDFEGSGKARVYKLDAVRPHLERYLVGDD